MSVSLSLHCKPSAALCAAVLLVHLTAIFCAWISLPAPAFWVAGAGLVVSFLSHWKKLRTPSHIDWRPEGVQLAGPGGLVYKMQFDGGAAPNAYWGVLRLKNEAGQVQHSLVTADCTDADAFRRLRMWLRWHPPFKAK